MCLQRLAQFIEYCCDICDVTFININILYQHVPTYIKMYPLWSTTVNYYQVSSAHNLINICHYQHPPTYLININIKKPIVNISSNTYKIEIYWPHCCGWVPTSAAMIFGSSNKVRQLGDTWVIHQDLKCPDTQLGKHCETTSCLLKNTQTCLFVLYAYVYICIRMYDMYKLYVQLSVCFWLIDIVVVQLM